MIAIANSVNEVLLLRIFNTVAAAYMQVAYMQVFSKSQTKH